MNNSKNSKALTIANALVRQGVSRSKAMRRAWRTVKQRVIHTKTAGVTRGNRQTLLYRLTRYSADLISVTLRREPENAADKNAVQVIAAVKGKGSVVMGYLNRQLAEAIAPLLDKGKQVLAKFEAVTGGVPQLRAQRGHIGVERGVRRVTDEEFYRQLEQAAEEYLAAEELRNGGKEVTA